MFYQTCLDQQHQLSVENRDRQTTVTISSNSLQQQQSQSAGFVTGKWVSPPQLYKVGTGYVIKLTSDRQEYFVLVRGNSITTVAEPNLAPHVKLEWQHKFDNSTEQEDSGFTSMQPMQPIQPMQPMQPMRPMQPMKPMQPLQMGDMSMNLNDMSMQMGNMSLRMKPPRKSNFCTQCGQKVQPSDRFCASCGNKLS